MAVAKGILNIANKAYPAVPGGLSTTWVTGKKYQLETIQGNVSDLGKKWKLFLYKQQEYCKVTYIGDTPKSIAFGVGGVSISKRSGHPPCRK